MREAREPREIEEGRGVGGRPAVRAEHVAGAMKQGSRRTCSEVWWVDKMWYQRNGGVDGGFDRRAARAALKMACPADHCGQPPQRTPPPLMHAGMPCDPPRHRSCGRPCHRGTVAGRPPPFKRCRSRPPPSRRDRLGGRNPSGSFKAPQ